MWLRLIGACAITVSSAGFGLRAAWEYRLRLRLLRDFISCLEEMQQQLRQNLLPLPQLVCIASELGQGTIYRIMAGFYTALIDPEAEDIPGCMRKALSSFRDLHPDIRRLLVQLGRCLGKFDLTGQLKGMEDVKTAAQKQLLTMEHEQNRNVRCYRTLGIFGGMALAVLLL